MNRWSDRSTHGKIPTIRDAPFDSSTGLAVTNAVYFKGKWASPFQEAKTGDRDFTLASGGRIRTRAMDQLSYYAYRRDTDHQVIRIPYPRFRVEQRLDLTPGLIALGMGVAFNCEAADFS